MAGSLFMRGGANFQKVRLIGAKVGAQLSAKGSTFEGRFNADRLEVTGDLSMRDGASFNDVDLSGAVIGGSLWLRDSDFYGHLDLTSVLIGDELDLNSPRRVVHRNPGDENFPPPRWNERARLTLRNAQVGALNDTEDAWGLQPGRLDLVGFTYDRLGGVWATKDSAMSARSTEWLRAWLAKQVGFSTSYNPQPFEQLAKVLRESGYPGKADAILFAARDHQRDSPATPWTSKVKLWLLWGDRAALVRRADRIGRLGLRQVPLRPAHACRPALLVQLRYSPAPHRAQQAARGGQAQRWRLGVFLCSQVGRVRAGVLPGRRPVGTDQVSGARIAFTA